MNIIFLSFRTKMMCLIITLFECFAYEVKITLELEKLMRLSPAHLRLWGGLGDNNRLPQLGLQVDLIVSVPEEVPLDGWSRFPCRITSVSQLSGLQNFSQPLSSQGGQQLTISPLPVSLLSQTFLRKVFILIFVPLPAEVVFTGL